MTLTYPDPSPQPPQETPPRPSRARRRRARRMVVPKGAEGRAALLGQLVRRAYPSYEFFLFAVLCGAILGAGYILDSQAFLIFGILMAPLMTPWVGMTLATVSGSARFFFQTLGAFIIGSLLIFASGLLAGLAARIWLPLTLNQAFVHARLWWPDLVALALAAILLTASFVRSEKKPFLPSVMVAYELFLPLNAAAFGLGSGVGDIWPQGLLVFAVHLAWATLFGTLTLIALGFKPFKLTGYFFGAVVLLIAAASLVALTGLGTIILQTAGIAPASTPEATVAAQVDVPTAEAIPSATHPPFPASSTPEIVPNATPSRTPTPYITLPPTTTATVTLTPQPTPLYARIHAEQGGGAYVRREPGGPVILTLDNGDLVQVLSEALEYGDVPWVHVKVVRGEQTFDGWIIQGVLLTATPAPGW